MVDVFLGQHLAHVRAPGGIADHGRAAADERDRAVACHLKPLHQAQRHEVTDMQRVCRAVKANVERRLAVVDHVADVLFIRHLRNQTARLQFFVNTHRVSPSIVRKLVNIIRRLPCLGSRQQK